MYHHETKVLVSYITQALEAGYPGQSGMIAAWWLLEKITGQPMAALRTQNSITLTPLQNNNLLAALEQIRTDNKPLQYVLEELPFASLTLRVQPPTLIPRPETEEWVSSFAEQLYPLAREPLRILDLCTGSGCIALTLAKALPRAHVVGIDVKESALDLAKSNAQRNNISNVSFHTSNLFEALDTHESFDFIVSNPPYVSDAEWNALDPHITQWEDRDALVAADDGLAILREIITVAPLYLRENPAVRDHGVAQLLLEIGHQQGQQVADLMNARGYSSVKVHRDLTDRDRVVSGRVVNVVHTASYT